MDQKCSLLPTSSSLFDSPSQFCCIPPCSTITNSDHPLSPFPLLSRFLWPPRERGKRGESECDHNHSRLTPCLFLLSSSSTLFSHFITCLDPLKSALYLASYSSFPLSPLPYSASYPIDIARVLIPLITERTAFARFYCFLSNASVNISLHSLDSARYLAASDHSMTNFYCFKRWVARKGAT